jgi:hypothetical protein
MVDWHAQYSARAGNTWAGARHRAAARSIQAHEVTQSAVGLGQLNAVAGGVITEDLLAVHMRHHVVAQGGPVARNRSR